MDKSAFVSDKKSDHKYKINKVTSKARTVVSDIFCGEGMTKKQNIHNNVFFLFYNNANIYFYFTNIKNY